MLAALLVSSPLLAQGVSLGFRAGIPITPVLTADGPQQAPASRFTIGPLIEVHLWRDTVLGADFLLRRSAITFSSAVTQRAELWLWQAPITLIYRFRVPARPFVRTGVSFNRVLDVSGATVCAHGPFGEQFYCLGGNSSAELRHRGTSGLVVGGGFRFQFKGFRLEPEVRLTHWFDRNFGVRDSAVRSNLNQVELLVGVIF
jgi:hypothetical protein